MAIKARKGKVRSKYSNAKVGKYIPSSHPRKYLGTEAVVEYKSSLEYKFMIHCDREPAIAFWGYENATLKYLDKSENPPKQRVYYIDFVIYLKTPKFMETGCITDCKKIWVEVKDSRDTRPSLANSKNLLEKKNYLKNISKWKAADEYTKSRGFGFRIITEQQLN
jgi:hypothetical protein